MNLPKTDFKVKLGPYQFDVVYDAELGHADNSPWGEARFMSQKIHLRPDMHQDQIQSTLIHELLHAAFFLGGLSRILSKKDIHVSEEDLVSGLDNIWYMVIKENPHIFGIRQESEVESE